MSAAKTIRVSSIQVSRLFFALSAALVLALAGCSGDEDGGPCTYDETAGTARIVSVEAPASDENNCGNDPVVVRFDFTPDDPSKVNLAEQGVLLTISAGANPPRAWVEASGLTVGSEHPATRRDGTSGTCTPQIFELNDVDEGAALAACY